MYINWYFEYFPKVFLTFSFVFNTLFIYLNLSDRKKTLGTYRYFLLAFSVFNTIYSVVDQLIPIAVYGSNYVVIIYLSDGPFFENLQYGQKALSTRGGFIALSYGILTVHFVYRYFALFNPRIIAEMTSKRGIFVLFIGFLSYGIVWSTVCELMMYATDDARDVARSEFLDTFNVNISEISFLNIVYRSPNSTTVLRCWIGLSILFLISGASISLYCTLGYKILKKLQNAHHVSRNTRRLHRQLFRTLAIQTSIPTIISFLPCMVVWVIPLFEVHLGNSGNLGVIALSAFPSVDALAVILLLPIYRNRLTYTHSAYTSTISSVWSSSRSRSIM